jgi:hypothetical protein
MKRCPTCDRTFDDNMRFCQTDGTPLVDGPEPVDPYKTMVARPGDIAAAIPPLPAEKPQPEPQAEEEVLEIPPADVDPKKTMYASEAEIRKAMSEVDTSDEQVIEAPHKAEPRLGSAPPSPFGTPNEPDISRTTPPIPSPFDMAPPRFEPAEEKFAAPEPPAFAEPERESAPDPFGSPFGAANEPSSPLAHSDSMPSPAAQDNWQDNQMQNPSFPQGGASAGVAAPNQTLAIVSLVLGILGLTLCCGTLIPSLAAIITGVMARGKANNDPAHYGGSGLAMGGLITGVLGILIGIAQLIFVFFMGGMQLIMQSAR